MCCGISRSTLARAKRNVFFKSDQKEQDKRLSFLMDVKVPKRSRIRGEIQKNICHRVAINYFLLTSSEIRKIPVCSKFFGKLFGIGQRRLNTIAEGILRGTGVTDMRGGDHKLKKYSKKREKVYELISKLRACESRYSRNKSQRLYLLPTLNINKLFQKYNSIIGEELKVKKTFFSKIFETKFNLGFGSPASDTCSFCKRTRTEIQACDGQKKQTLMANLHVHEVRTKAFHGLMKGKPYGSVSFVFDLQVQPLPRT